MTTSWKIRTAAELRPGDVVIDWCEAAQDWIGRTVRSVRRPQHPAAELMSIAWADGTSQAVWPAAEFEARR